MWIYLLVYACALQCIEIHRTYTHEKLGFGRIQDLRRSVSDQRKLPGAHAHAVLLQHIFSAVKELAQDLLVTNIELNPTPKPKSQYLIQPIYPEAILFKTLHWPVHMIYFTSLRDCKGFFTPKVKTIYCSLITGKSLAMVMATFK